MEAPEVLCSFTGCSSVPGKESKFPGVKNTEEEKVFKSSNHTILCEDNNEDDVKSIAAAKLEYVDENADTRADTNKAAPTKGVFIASIDDAEISATDLDDAAKVIENIVRTKGLLAEGNHLMTSEMELHCDGHENWTIVSEKFRYVMSWKNNNIEQKSPNLKCCTLSYCILICIRKEKVDSI